MVHGGSRPGQGWTGISAGATLRLITRDGGATVSVR